MCRLWYGFYAQRGTKAHRISISSSAELFFKKCQAIVIDEQKWKVPVQVQHSTLLQETSLSFRCRARSWWGKWRERRDETTASHCSDHHRIVRSQSEELTVKQTSSSSSSSPWSLTYTDIKAHYNLREQKKAVGRDSRGEINAKIRALSLPD